MQLFLETIKWILTYYWGQYAYQGMFYLALVVILVIEKDKIKKHMLATYALFIVLIITNPITVEIMKLFFSVDGYYSYYPRLFSTMPLICIIAYGMVLLLKETEGKSKLALTFVVSAMIVVGGNNVYATDWMQKTENLSKVPNEVRQLSDMLHAEKEGDITVAVPTDLSSSMRLIDASLYMPYGRIPSAWGAKLGSDASAAEEILLAAGKHGCDFLVTKATPEWRDAFWNLGHSPVNCTENYLIFKVEGIPRRIYTYNELRQVEKIDYIDENGSRYNSSSGYASVTYDYDEKGRNICEMYYTADGNSFINSQGYSGLKTEYYKNGLMAKMIYLGSDGMPIDITLGYSMIEYEYDDQNREVVNRYYDNTGEPIALKKGYYGRLLDYDKEGNISKITYVGMNDEPIMVEYGYSTITMEYDQNKKNIYEQYFDETGKPVSLTQGNYGIKRTYNEFGCLTKLTYVDEKGFSVNIDSGYASILYEYDSCGNITREKYLDKDDNITLNNKGYAIKVYLYDEAGNEIGKEYYNENEKLLN